MCIVKKREYYEKLTNKLDSVNDAKSWWNAAREIQGRTFTIGVAVDINSLTTHFYSLLNPRIESIPILYAAPYTLDPFLDSPIEMFELRTVLQKLKDNKAAGDDRVPYEFYKNAPMGFLDLLLKAYNYCYNSQHIPVAFSNSIIFPVHKKGDINQVENYRGLSFMNAIAKIFVSILYHRLSFWVDQRKILSESQAGFRAGYSTVDNIFNLISIIKLAQSMKKKKVYAFFVDFKSAFDTVDRRALFYKLFNYGVSHKMISILQEIYRNTKAQVWDGFSLSESFETCGGVRQGCVLSPLLFALFINDLEDFLETGLVLLDVEIKILLYADDIVLISDSPIKLQGMINSLEEYCKLWNLVVNLDKSKVMIFQRGGGIRRQDEKWSFGGNQIEVVKAYTYLGVLLTPKLSMQEHLKQRLQTAKTSINCTWQNFLRKKDIKHSEKFKVFNAVSRSILCYGAQIWGYMQYENVEKLQRFFIKKMFYLPRYTPNYALTLETGLSDLYIYTLRCHYLYICKVLNQYNNDRLPKKLAKMTIDRQIYWYETLLELKEKHDIDLDMREEPINSIKSKLLKIVEAEDIWLKRRVQGKAESTVRHGLYDKLNYGIAQNYFKNENSLSKISLIMKYRCGLIYLNASPWRSEGSSLCSLCNLLEDEDLMHFLGVCPILAEFRVKIYGKKTLNEDEIIEILNGKDDYKNLILYVTNAWRYRTFLVSEFNN